MAAEIDLEGPKTKPESIASKRTIATLNLYTPSQPLPVVSIKVLRVSIPAESFNIGDDFTLKEV